LSASVIFVEEVFEEDDLGYQMVWWVWGKFRIASDVGEARAFEHGWRGYSGFRRGKVGLSKKIWAAPFAKKGKFNKIGG